MPMLFRIIAVAVALLTIAGCEKQKTLPVVVAPAVTPQGDHPAKATTPQTGGIVFRDRTAESQIRFTYRNDEEHSDFSIVESLGGGVAIFDFDQDGRKDVFLPGGGTFGHRQTSGLPSSLFRQITDWRFVDVTGPAFIGPSRHYSHGAAVADCNEDGFDDVLITGFGGLTLYQNQGDGSFRDVTAESKLDDRLWSSSAAWGDFNGDGVLDLYVAHYVDWSFDKHPLCEGPAGHPRDVCPPRQFNGLPDAIYFGKGDGEFHDATADAGLQPDGKGLGVVAADIDLDGDLDVYVCNDTVANFLYRNDGHGHFEDISLTSGTAFSDRGTPDGSMGTDVGDYNGDGLPDIWVTNYERENNALYRNLGNGIFRHVSQATGMFAIGGMYVGWGTRFIDADLDGDEDLFVTNSHAIRFAQDTPRLQRPLMLENSNLVRFVNITDHTGEYLSSAHAGRGMATGDLDGDGDEDIVVSHLNEPAAVLSNESTPKRHWLVIRLIGTSSARSSIGARAVARIGNKSMTRQIRGGSSYLSASDKGLHFGCDSAAQIDELTVTWISGGRVVLHDIPCNQVVTILEPTAIP
jgi:hypothetical protein